MATARKSSNGAGSAEYSDLSDQIAVLKDDIAQLGSLIGDLTSQQKDQVVRTAKERGERIKESGIAAAQDAGRQLAAAEDNAREVVRAHPGASMGLALAAGFIAGLATARR